MPKVQLNIPVPSAQTRGIDLRVVDINEAEFTFEAESNGAGFASTDNLQQGMWWRIERITVNTQGQLANGCEITVYQGDDPNYPQRARDWTPLPVGFVAVSEYPSYLTILPTRCLTVACTGATPGALFMVSAAYQLVVKVPAESGKARVQQLGL